MRDRYFEDFSTGERFRSRGVTFTESSIIDFAFKAEVVEIRPSSSKPDRGVVRIAYAAVSQRGETVMTLSIAQMVIRRPTSVE